MSELKSRSGGELDNIIRQILGEGKIRLDPNNIRAEYWIDLGQDSFVVKVGGKIYKFYGKGFGGISVWEQQVRLYQEITNQAMELVDRKKSALEVTPEISYRFRINPIEEVLMSDNYHVVVGVSPFVSGLSVDKAGIFSDHELGEFFDRMEMEISNELGVKGIRIDGYNVKVSEGCLVATDLCSSVTSLKKV